MAWCFIRRQKQNPKDVAEITDRKTSKSQQENRVLPGAYAAVIYCAVGTWNHGRHSRLHRINAFNSTAPRSCKSFPSQPIINTSVCFCLRLRWCNKLLTVCFALFGRNVAVCGPVRALLALIWFLESTSGACGLFRLLEGLTCSNAGSEPQPYRQGSNVVVQSTDTHRTEVRNAISSILRANINGLVRGQLSVLQLGLWSYWPIQVKTGVDSFTEIHPASLLYAP